MSNNPPPADEAGMLQNTDPFANDEAGASENHDGDEDSLRLAGVRSANPFANGEEETPNELGPESAVSPTAGGQGTGANVFDSTLEDSNDQSEFGPTSAISPGGAGVFSNTDPFDHATGQTSAQHADSNTATQDEVQPTISNVNGDRAERGTDVFANADPVFPEGQDNGNDSSGLSGKDSDSDSGAKDGGKPRVAFADKDAIDQTPTHADDDNESPDVVNKIKSTISTAKDKVHLSNVKATGAFKKMNPTNVRMNVRFGDDAKNDVGIIWRSRDNRKGRNSVVIPRTSMAYPNLPAKNRPVYTSSFKGVRRNLYRMAFTFPYWDMAFWSGWSYAWGSVLFIIDSVWAWLPYGWDINIGWIDDYGVGIAFFVGALLYQLGATMAYLEAVNDGSFQGSAMKRFLEGHEEDKKQLLDEKINNFFGHLHPLHHKKQHDEEEAELEKAQTVDPEAGWRTIHRRDRPGSIYPGGKLPAPRRGGVDLGEAEEGESHEYLTWRWYPTWHALRTHHVYEIGYIACTIQLFGATLYSWCGLDSVPGISTRFNDTQYYAAYWMPEILGSCCFLTASLMFLVETQEKWYKPQPNVVGWWIGFWAMVGSTGFLLIGVFGVIAQATGAHWASYQSECSSTWGSTGYLLSSLCQWYEAVNKHPVEEAYDEPGDIKSYQVHLP